MVGGARASATQAKRRRVEDELIAEREKWRQDFKKRERSDRVGEMVFKNDIVIS